MHGHGNHPLSTTQETTLHMGITRWSIPKSDWLYSLQQRWRSSIQSAKTRRGADNGSYHELIVKFRLKLKKVGKTILIQVWPKSNPLQLYSGSDKQIQGIRSDTQCLKNYGWRFVTLYRRQESGPSPRKKKCKKAKWLSEEALQIAEKRREVKSKGKKERSTHLNAEFQRLAKR